MAPQMLLLTPSCPPLVPGNISTAWALTGRTFRRPTCASAASRGTWTERGPSCCRPGSGNVYLVSISTYFGFKGGGKKDVQERCKFLVRVTVVVGGNLTPAGQKGERPELYS